MLAALLAVTGIPGGVTRAAAVTHTMSWDTRPDFESNASTTGEPSTLSGVSTQREPGSVTLPGSIAAVAAGGNHTVGLTADGHVVAVGFDSDGECDVSTWDDMVAVAAGERHTIGLRADHTVTAVGLNGDGQTDVSTWDDIVAVAAGERHTIGLRADHTVTAVGLNGDGQTDVSTWDDIVAVAAGAYHTVGLKSDGTVEAIGRSSDGQTDVSTWDDIVAVAAGAYHTVGLKSDGTVVAAGRSSDDQLDVSTWDDIVAVSAGLQHTVGLTSDGTLMATGSNVQGQCNVSGWDGIAAVAAGGRHTVGLKSDGTLVAVGANEYGQCNAAARRDIVTVSAGVWHSLGLTSDGTVEAVGDNYNGQCDVTGWDDITAISAGGYHSVGLKSDGTVETAGDNNYGQCAVTGWDDITAISAGYYYTMGLKSDGTVVAVGHDESLHGAHQLDVSGWDDITAMAVGTHHAVGLKSDGTVVAVGCENLDHQLDVSGWSDIVAISARFNQTVGLKGDGTVVATGRNVEGQCDVSGWSDIVAISAGTYHTVGITSDGSVVAVGSDDHGQLGVSDWSDIGDISAGYRHTVGLTSDSRPVDAGDNQYHQCELSGWATTSVEPRSGSIGGTGAAVGLRAQAPEALYEWKGLDAVTSELRPGEAVKFAVRFSDDGADWSEPLGRDGEPIDWTNGSGNYLGRAEQDTTVRADLSALPASSFIDIVVRLESDGVLTPELERVSLSCEVNHAPVAHADSVTIAEDNVLSALAPGVLGHVDDDDGDVLKAVKVKGPDHGTLILGEDGAYTYTPHANWHGTDSFIYKANDSIEDSNDSAVTITVNPVNDVPVAGADAYAVAEDAVLAGAQSVCDNDTDVEHDPFTAVRVSGPAHGTLALNPNGTFTYTPHANWHGIDTFTYKAQGAAGDSSVAKVVITVNAVVDPTSFVVSSAPKTLSAAGATYAFTGALKSGADPVSGRRVVLQSAANAAGPWKNTAVAADTAPDGSFVFRVKPLTKTHYRANFVGDSDFSAGSSDSRSVTPRASLGTPVAPKTMKRSKSYVVYGSLKPKHTKGTKPVRIYKYKKVGTKWVKKGYVKAKAYNYRGHTRYKLTMKLTSKGSWRLRACAPSDSGHATTWSSKYDYVKVK